MPKFAMNILNMAVTTTLKGAIALTTVAGARAEMVEIIGTGAGTSSAADVQHAAIISYSDGGTLAAGSATPIPEKFDQNSALSIFTSTLVDTELTTEPATLNALPTVTFGYNQRGGMRWAVPRGEGLIIAFDTTDEDWVYQTDASGNGNINPSCHWWES